MNYLFDKLVAYCKDDYYPFHMPGSKRNDFLSNGMIPYGLDITEIDDFDDLHHPQSILKNIANRASVLYQTKNSYLSVNNLFYFLYTYLVFCLCEYDLVAYFFVYFF